jgi:hypothetical protein
MTRLLTLFAVTAVLALTAVVAFAEDATVTITGGALTSTAANVALTGVTLDGTDKTTSSAYTANSWQIVDARGTGAGYCVTIDSTDFTSGGYTIDVSSADQEFKITIDDANTVVNAGQSGADIPASEVASLTAITENPTTLNILSAAADKGMGDYTYKPAFELEVRAETYAGSYTATIIVTANSGACV